VDSQALMDIFAMDEKLNISRRYLRPGLAFGGSCLPKDVRGLVRFAQNAGIEIPVLESVLPSNDRHAERCVRLIEGKGNRRVGVLGITFKANTDDLRESPMVRIVERLDTDGYDVRVFDANLKAPVNGASVELRRLRNLLVTDVDEVLRHAETLVISNSDKVYRDLVSRIPSNVCVVDFAHMCGTRVTRDGPEEHDDRLPRDHILMHGSEPAGEYRFGENYHRT
ncbi:MAG TPA: UDP binding domain-containing protein, partial [Bryobacteraceae bacterium]|nr:UDP binding domain-containing protein [Bryobacteraceae bacterium]